MIIDATKSSPEEKDYVVRKIFEGSGDKIFSCIFTKKDGSEREMVARLGCHKGVKGTAKYDTKKSQEKTHTLRVYDMQKDAWRTINLLTVKFIKTRKAVIHFVDEPEPEFSLLALFIKKGKIQTKRSVWLTVNGH